MTTIEPGIVIDTRYRLEKEIGKGGFGVVYKATQLSTGQQVAMKLLLKDKLAGAEGAELEVRRFQREMELVARLRHPNIVRLIDTGQLDEHRLYQVLEFIEGEELAAIIRDEGALKPYEAKDLMFQILDALSAAHELGVVHRDMKPQNVMLTVQGFRRNAMVLDFGIAGIAEEARDVEYKTLTMEGRIHGTPQYMAPEQLKGEASDPRIDIYAWGLVFLEVLTGRKIMSRNTLAEIIAAVMSAEPVPIPIELTEHPLGAVIGRAIAKDQSQRFENAQQALLALQDIDIPRDFSFPWTGTKASDEQMHSSSISGPVHGADSQQTMLYDSGSVSAPMWRPGTGQMPYAGTASVPQHPAISGAFEPGAVSGQLDAQQASGRPIIVLAVVLGLLAVAGIVGFVVLSGDDVAKQENTAADADKESTATNGGKERPEANGGTASAPVTPTDDTERPAVAQFVEGRPIQPEGTRGGEMTWVGGGTFQVGGNEGTMGRLMAHCRDAMGEYADMCAAELFAIEVGDNTDVPPFFADLTEVTQASWNRCHTDGTCALPQFADCHALTSEGAFEHHGLSGADFDTFVGALSSETRPAVCISREAAASFCTWAGKRLPTSSEHEFLATRKGTALYPWGDETEKGGRRANGSDPTLAGEMGWTEAAPIILRKSASDADGHGFLAPVNSYPDGATPEGIVDLGGNAKEWVSTDASQDGKPIAIARGGSWAEPGPWLSGRTRSLLSSDTLRTDLGFRCVADVPKD